MLHVCERWTESAAITSRHSSASGTFGALTGLERPVFKAGSLFMCLLAKLGPELHVAWKPDPFIFVKTCLTSLVDKAF